MHYIFSTFGSAGDMHPMLGLALAFRRLGHEVTFIVNGYFRDLVERFGFEFSELGSQEQFLAGANHPDLWHPRRAFRHIYRSLIEPSVRPQYEALASRYKPGNTVGVTNCLGFGALLAQDKLGMPIVTVHLQPAVLWSDLQPPKFPGMIGPLWFKSLMYGFGERVAIDSVACPSLNALRAEFDLPPVRRITRSWNSSTCVACLFPDWFCSPPPDWPKNLIQTDFPLWDERQADRAPDDVEAFLTAGEPPLVFTPGSANLFGRSFFDAAVGACRLLNCRGILLTRFPEQIPPSLPPGVVHFPFVPLSLLLPRCAAFVNHGGIGSVSQAMAAGIPQLIMPLAHDQIDNAARIQRFGVGSFLSPRRFTARRVVKKLRALLESKSTAANCQVVAEKLARKDGLERMALAISKQHA